MGLYLVYIAESIAETPPVIVTAETKEEALRTYTKQVLLRDDHFLESIYGRSINASHAYRFLRDKDGSFYDDETGNFRVDEAYAWDQFEKNVRDFFEEHPHFADLYLDFYNSDDQYTPQEAAEKWSFPAHMLLMMLQDHDNYFGDITVTAIDDLELIE